MKNKVFNVIIAVCGLALSGCTPSSNEPATVFPIAEVIEQLKRELTAAQSVPGASIGLNLEKVEATFAVTRSVDANGKASIGIPAWSAEADLSGSKKAMESSSVLVEMAPPKPLGILSSIDADGFGLTEVIIETRQQLIQGLLEEPKLEPNKVVITVKFTVERAATGSAKIKLVVLSIGGGAKIAKTLENSVVLTFAREIAP